MELIIYIVVALVMSILGVGVGMFYEQKAQKHRDNVRKYRESLEKTNDQENI